MFHRLAATCILAAVLAALLLLMTGEAPAQSQPGQVAIRVRETAGLRRFGYPVSVEVPFPRGVLREARQALLEDAGTVVRPVQSDVRERWPDGSIQWLSLSFNLSPGPREERELRLRYGPQVAAPEIGAPVVEETEDSFRIRGIYRIARKGPAFIESLRYGQREFLRAPAGWKAWATGAAEGAAPLALAAGSERSRVLSPGPVNAVVELSGAFQGSRGPVPYTLTVSQPNSKSWFDARFEVDDPHGETGALRLTVPYVLESESALYDFGVGSWVYGVLRGRQAAVLEWGRRDPWRILTGEGSALSPYAVAPNRQARAEGWAHLIDGAQGGRAVGFGTPGGGDEHAISITASGETAITWRWRGKGIRRVRALFHQVVDPIQVSAATSPPSMLSPLEVSLPSEWYRRAGVRKPGGRASRQP